MITQEELKSLLTYNPETGIFHWLKKGTGRRPNLVAGTIRKDEYVHIAISRSQYYAHRLAWLYVYGKLPINEIDHINQNRSDNKISNLRDIAQAKNKKNKALYKKNSTGMSGVYLEKFGTYAASITVDKKQLWLGRFKNIEDAFSARKEAEIKYGFHENHGK